MVKSNTGLNQFAVQERGVHMRLCEGRLCVCVCVCVSLWL